MPRERLRRDYGVERRSRWIASEVINSYSQSAQDEFFRSGQGVAHCFVIRHSCVVILVIAHLWLRNSKISFLKHSRKLSRKVFSKPSVSSPARRRRTSLSLVANGCSICARTITLGSPIILRSSRLRKRRSTRTALEWPA